MYNTSIYFFGDSILANQAYVDPGCSVIEKVFCNFSDSTLDNQLVSYAKDGALTADIYSQVEKVVNINLKKNSLNIALFTGGGNDALGMIDYFNHRNDGSGYSLNDKYFVMEWKYWTNKYKELLDLCVSNFNIVIPCTIYNSIPTFSESDKMVLRLFNDYIVEMSSVYDVDFCDLRTVMKFDESYSKVSSIEPSELGGGLISNLIFEQIKASFLKFIKSQAWYEGY